MPLALRTNRSTHALSRRLLYAASALSLVLPASAWAQSGRSDAASASHSFSIAAQPLEVALGAYMQQSGVQVGYESADVAGRTSAAVNGAFGPGEALSRLLSGTGLTYRFTAPTAVRLEPAPAADAGTVQLGPVRVGSDAGASSRPAIDAPPPVYAGGQVARGGRVGFLSNRDVLETPFNQTSYTSELVEDQQATTIGDVLDNDPSIRRAWPASGFYEYFQIRGFNVNSGDISFNGLYGMVPRYGGIPADFAERIEVLKGPSALLSGISPNGLVGGAINIVPKRAGDAPLTRLGIGIESDSLLHARLDVGRRFGPDGRFGVRFNARVSDGDTYIDGQSKKGSNTEAIALDYRGDRVRVALDAFRVEDRNRGGSSLAVSLGGTLTSMPSAPNGHTNVSPWASGNARTEAVVLSGEFDLTDHITAYAKAGYRQYQYNGFLLSSVFNLQQNGNVSALALKFPYDTHGDSEELGVRAAFNTGPIKHSLVLGGSRQTDNVKDGFSFQSITTNIYAPITPVINPTPSPTPLLSNKLNFGSLAVADTMSAFGERVLLTLGVRRQNVKTSNFNNAGKLTASYNKSAWTPMAGLVVRATEHFSLYGNMIQGLSPGVAVGNTYNNAGEVFPPYKSKQFEVGAKLETGSIINTLSFFQIKKPSTLIDNSTTPLPTLRLNGEQRNRGVEWNIAGALTPQFRVLGGVTYTQGRLTATQGGAQDGNAAPGAAPWATNLGVEWDTPGLEGLTLTGRVINTSSQYVDSGNKIKIPGWTRVDVGARYATVIGDQRLVFRANVQNLFDKDYWEGVNSPGTATLGAPRTFQLSASVDF